MNNREMMYNREMLAQISELASIPVRRVVVYGGCGWTEVDCIASDKYLFEARCWIGESITPQEGDVIFLLCSTPDDGVEYDTMPFSGQASGVFGVITKTPYCACGYKDGIGGGHTNSAGGYCCPHWGNTCGDHPYA